MAHSMGLVERKLQATAESEVEVASDMSTRLFSAGGKRIRPALVVLAATACGASAEDTRVVDLAVAAELVHTASLIHDDVIDETAERRGIATTNARWGNKMSVLGGDFLLSKAFGLLADVGSDEVLRVLSTMAVGMSEAEMLQSLSEGSVQLWEQNYWRIISGKTARFMRVCCECGAILAGAVDEARSALAEYGTHLGIAFQITDDLLDITGDPALTGKDIGTDLLHGKFTLPVLKTLSDAEAGPKVRALLAGRGSRLTLADAREVARLTDQCGAAAETRATALEYSRRAITSLDPLPESAYKESLVALAASVVERTV